MYLRAVSVKTGEVLTTVTTSKTISSVALSANVFAYVASDKILQSELGYTTNELGQIALRQAIEKAVYALVMEGADMQLWQFQDQQAGWPLIWRYRQERDGIISPAPVETGRRRTRAGSLKMPVEVSKTRDGAAQVPAPATSSIIDPKRSNFK